MNVHKVKIPFKIVLLFVLICVPTISVIAETISFFFPYSNTPSHFIAFLITVIALSSVQFMKPHFRLESAVIFVALLELLFLLSGNTFGEHFRHLILRLF